VTYIFVFINIYRSIYIMSSTTVRFRCSC